MAIRWRPAQPGKSWRWPYEVSSIPDLLTLVVRDGFELVSVDEGTALTPRYKLRRDGELSPFGTLDQTIASAAHGQRKYFEFGKREADGTLPLKLTEKALRKAPTQ